jgi:hypothetical protein
MIIRLLRTVKFIIEKGEEGFKSILAGIQEENKRNLSPNDSPPFALYTRDLFLI